MISELTALHGVSGDIAEVRDYIVKKLNCPYEIDSKGNIICHKEGKGKRVMVCAHMDEVGFIVTGVTEAGDLKFASVGGIDPRVMISKAVRFKNGIAGVIGYKAIHLQSKAERAAEPGEDELYIDIGAKNRDDALGKVKIGDTACFVGDYVKMGENRFAAKAIDDRAGCECLLRLTEKEFDVDFYAVFSDCEEIGGLGALAAAESIRPDIALVLEGTTCSDIPGTCETDTVTHLGGGAVIPVRDRSMTADRTLTALLKKTAEEENIPWQYKRTTAGGTDGGVIHLSSGGIRTAVLAIPVRYIHSAYSVADTRDLEAMCRLAEKFLERAGEEL